MNSNTGENKTATVTVGKRPALNTDHPIDAETLMLDVDRIAAGNDDQTLDYLNDLTIEETRTLLAGILRTKQEHENRIQALHSLEGITRENTQNAARTAEIEQTNARG